MTTIYWIIAGLLALLYLFAGAQKLVKPAPELAESGMGWATQIPPAAVKGIGLLEVLGALGLVLPPLTGIATGLAPWAAVGLAVLQVAAVVTHLRRGEAKVLPVNVVLLVAAVVVAGIGFGQWA